MHRIDETSGRPTTPDDFVAGIYRDPLWWSPRRKYQQSLAAPESSTGAELHRASTQLGWGMPKSQFSGNDAEWATCIRAVWFGKGCSLLDTPLAKSIGH